MSSLGGLFSVPSSLITIIVFILIDGWGSTSNTTCKEGNVAQDELALELMFKNSAATSVALGVKPKSTSQSTFKED